jgi:hypothetical protein
LGIYKISVFENIFFNLLFIYKVIFITKFLMDSQRVFEVKVNLDQIIAEAFESRRTILVIPSQNIWEEFDFGTSSVLLELNKRKIPHYVLQDNQDISKYDFSEKYVLDLTKFNYYFDESCFILKPNIRG